MILSINDRVVAIVAIFVKDNSLELTLQEGQPIKKKKKEKERPGISPFSLERLWNGFDLDAELFMYGTQLMHKFFASGLTEMSIFRLLNLIQLQ